MDAQETRRKLVHMLGGFGPPVSVTLLGWTASVSILVFIAAYVSIGGLLNARGVRLPIIGAMIHGTERTTERVPVPAIEFLLVTLVLGVSFHEPWFFPAIALLAFGDGAAGLIGVNWGRTKLPWNRRKSLEGLAAGIVVGSLTAGLFAWIGVAVHQEAWETDPLVFPYWPVPLFFCTVGFFGIWGVTHFFVRRNVGLRFSNAGTATILGVFVGALVLAGLPLAVEGAYGELGAYIAPARLGGLGAGLVVYAGIAGAVAMVVESFLRRHDNAVLPITFTGVHVALSLLDPFALG